MNYYYTGFSSSELRELHIIFHDNLYYMYYCAGGVDGSSFKIHLATSSNLSTWKRHPNNPMVIDGFNARDPFVLRAENEWIMYYCATEQPSGGHNVVAYRTSTDLITWGTRNVAFIDDGESFSDSTESPFVVQRGSYYYLFLSLRGGSYAGTDVFVSNTPYKWGLDDKIAHLAVHAPEVILDVDNKWYISHCGWAQGGVFLAPLTWSELVCNHKQIFIFFIIH